MAKSTKVTKSKAAQTLSKEMKQVVEGMIQKALKPSHKQLSALEQKLQALKMGKATKVATKSKVPAKAKSKKSKALKELKA